MSDVKISRGNAMVFVVGPIRGRDPADNKIKLFAQPTTTGFVTLTAPSNVILGSNKVFTAIVPGIFVPWYTAIEVGAILDAVGGALVDQMTLWHVLTGTDFRVATELTYDAARIVE